MGLKLFTCTDHEGLWPVPVASIVLAEDEAQARDQLRIALGLNGLGKSNDFTLTEVDLGVRQAIVLSNGDY